MQRIFVRAGKMQEAAALNMKRQKLMDLKFYMKNNSDLFDGTPKQAFDGFSKIKASIQGKRKNPCYTWKGWRLISRE